MILTRIIGKAAETVVLMFMATWMTEKALCESLMGAKLSHCQLRHIVHRLKVYQMTWARKREGVVLEFRASICCYL